MEHEGNAIGGCLVALLIEVAVAGVIGLGVWLIWTK